LFSQNPISPEGVYFADPSAHVWNNGKLYLYGSLDESNDYYCSWRHHVMETSDMKTWTIHNDRFFSKGKNDQVPYNDQLLFAPDCAFKNDTFYLYYCQPDQISAEGVATSLKPEGPFTPEPRPIDGSYSIDPAVLKDNTTDYYIYFGGLWGGQLQRYRKNKAIECGAEPANNEQALCAKVAKLSANMIDFAEEPRDVVILDENGEPLKAGDHDRRYFEGPWMHKYKGKYYFSYSTGNTHLLCYAIGDNPYGPFTYQGVILTPVVGWTTHHSICEFKGKWYLFHHDSKPSGGKIWLRSIKVVELKYNPDGTIVTLDGLLT